MAAFQWIIHQCSCGQEVLRNHSLWEQTRNLESEEEMCSLNSSHVCESTKEHVSFA